MQHARFVLTMKICHTTSNGEGRTNDLLLLIHTMLMLEYDSIVKYGTALEITCFGHQFVVFKKSASFLLLHYIWESSSISFMYIIT